jgi:acetyltransferase
MATDSIIANKGRLAVLSQKTLDTLNNSLPPFWSKGNPIDILGDSKADRYELTIETCLDDENIDGIIIIYTGQAIGVSEEIAKSLVNLLKKKGRKKPILTSFMGYKTVEEANQILTENGIPIYSTPEQAVRTYMYLYQYKYNLDMLYETPEELPMNISSPKLPLISMLKDVAFEDREILTEEEAKIFMVHCNLPVVVTQRARDADEAVLLASKIGYPVVLKILSPQIIHKTDAGGVILNINDENELREAFDVIIQRANKYDPKADIQGVTVQPMIKTDGYEVIIGAKQDHLFGPVILFGMGGIGVEVFKDVVMGLPPLNQALARKMIESTKVYEMLKGYRNKPPANLKLLEEIIVRFSQMTIDFPQIKEVDINPLIIDEKEAIVLDARIILDKEKTLKRMRTHENLVIIPYPSKYEDYTKLRNGKEVLLRAIKPEDEPLLLDMFNNIVEETKDYQLVVWYSLTFQPIRDRSHAVVARYCNIDYDKEITIIAETYEEEKRAIIGLIRLLIDGNTGEVAYIISNQWNDLGLEEKLIENIIQISREKYLDKINTKIYKKIIKFLKKSDFNFDNLNARIVKASLTL